MIRPAHRGGKMESESLNKKQTEESPNGVKSEDRIEAK
jgi:hypothetical protein